ncbi:Ketoisovalerate oxidoreductase subunit VorD [uncultured archaeon]|nr:Ketoisovalerate oxidoreductase subunit VorD [uncultured archaeon]
MLTVDQFWEATYLQSAVYFAGVRARSDRKNKQSKIERLFDAAGFDELIGKGILTAIKLHFGERGNDTFVNPILVRPIADRIRACGGKPFLTDTNTLYGGSRANAVDHLQTAAEHGFGCTVAGAPVIIADGLQSDNYREVQINKKHFKHVKIAGEIASSGSMIVVSHFKAHLPAGFGGAIKNLGMGCAPAAGKAEQHSAKPIFNAELCQGCGICAESCPRSAITVEKKIRAVHYEVCTGCGKCLRVCPTHTLDFNWFVEVAPFMERLVEYALGAISGKEGRVGFYNILLNITPDCDCVPWSDASLVPDIGILASRDPVAIDKASYDLVNLQMGLANSLLRKNHEPGMDKFLGVWENTLGNIQIEYGDEIGLGSKEYRLVEID